MEVGSFSYLNSSSLRVLFDLLKLYLLSNQYNSNTTIYDREFYLSVIVCLLQISLSIYNNSLETTSYCNFWQGLAGHLGDEWFGSGAKGPEFGSHYSVNGSVPVGVSP